MRNGFLGPTTFLIFFALSAQATESKKTPPKISSDYHFTYVSGTFRTLYKAVRTSDFALFEKCWLPRPDLENHKEELQAKLEYLRPRLKSAHLGRNRIIKKGHLEFWYRIQDPGTGKETDARGLMVKDENKLWKIYEMP